MSVTNIDNVIQEGDRLFAQKKLSEAQRVLHRALEMSEGEDYEKGLIISNLLLGRVYATQARYTGDRESLQAALACARQAEQIPCSSSNGLSINVALTFGEIFENQKEHEQSIQYYEQALQSAQQQGNTEAEISAYCAMSRVLVKQNDFAQAFIYIEKAQDLLTPETTELLKAEVYNQLSQIFVRRQKYGRVVEYSEEALRISREAGDVEKELTALNQLAIYYGTRSDYKTAMEYFLLALEKGKTINYRQSTAHIVINIATIYASLFNYKEAIKRYQTVLEDYSDVIEDYRKVIVYNNLGNVHYLSQETEKALDYFSKAHNLAKETNYQEMVIHSMAQKSRSLVALGQIPEALAMAQEVQELIKELGDINGKQINLINLGNICFQQKKYDQAIRLISQGIVAAKRMEDDEHEIRGYQILAQVYRELGDFENALDYQLVYSRSQADFSKIQRSRQILDQEIQFAIKEKQKEIEQLTKENEYQALLLKQSDQITAQNAQLLQANEELRQFAYVASHDLKEPLRMIGSYTQLIHRRFKAEVDEDTTQFFDFVNEGVIRMNNLLDALLRYATIGKTTEEKEPVKLLDTVDIAIINLRVSIEESEALIQCDALPEVKAIQSLLVQLFQNLISNAIKFRNPDTQPKIRIHAETFPDHYLIKVQDNGIGIHPDYKDRIFIIFQRLHNRTQYSGTGIGLAICQKIIQRLGGSIWVESQSGEGACFCFTLPR